MGGLITASDGPNWIEEAERAGWLPPLVRALAPEELEELKPDRSSEGVVAYLIRVARSSKRAKARQTALVNLFPAARDRVEGVTDLALDRLSDDPGKFVRYEACRLLAIAHQPETLAAIQSAQAEGIEVPWNGLAGACRAIEQGERNAFYDRPGAQGRTNWLVQDEQTDFRNGGTIVLGSAAYGTIPR